MGSSAEKLTETTNGAVQDKYATRHWALDYWELTRLHKFPMGVDITFWPMGMSVSLAARSAR